MKVELFSLVVMTLFFLWAWLPGSIAKRRSYGRAYLLSNRDAKDLDPLPAWGDRTNRAYENLKNYYPAFAVAILALCLVGRSDLPIQIAAVSYVVSRVFHFTFYTAGIVWGRAAAWIIGIVANTYLLIRVV
jgi:uncharacterized MAPEG superfamily protein